MEEVTQVNGTAQIESKSYFDGGLLQFLGWGILGGFVTLLTLAICAPFAMCWLHSWKAKHTVLDGRRLKFTGTAGDLFGTWIVCLLLTIITLGIYSLWISIRVQRGKVSHTHLFSGETL